MKKFPIFFVLAAFLWCLSAGSASAAPLQINQEKPGKNDDALARLLDDVGKQAAEIINIQRELVSRPAVNPEFGGQGEEEKSQWIEGWLKKKGFTRILRLDYPDARVPGKVRPNLIIRYPEEQSEPGRRLWLVVQMDTSPPEDLGEWKHSPYALRVEGDTLHGNGVEENNQGIATALLLLSRLKEQGANPPMALGVVLTAGEQASNKMGIAYVLDNFPELFSRDDLFVLFDYGDKVGSEIETAEKRYLWMKISVEGKEYFAGHAYKAINPVSAGAELIVAMEGLDTEFPERDGFFSQGRNFFTPTKAESSNVSANYVPGEFVFHLDARLLPSCDAGKVIDSIRRKADAVEKKRGARIKFEVTGLAPEARPTPPDAPVVRALMRAIAAELGLKAKTVGRGGVTMATMLRHRGFFAAVWSIHARRDEVPTEHASVAAHLRQAAVFIRMLFDGEAAKAGDFRAGRRAADGAKER